jgi:hypothetical protein
MKIGVEQKRNGIGKQGLIRNCQLYVCIIVNLNVVCVFTLKCTCEETYVLTHVGKIVKSKPRN